jgi:large subunit ribosomal protein L24
MGRRSSARASAARKRRSLKIRSGDRVRVLAGKDRGKSGRVLRVEPAKERLYVEGLNMNKRAVRSRSTHETSQFGGGQTTGKGGVIEREGPIHISNVMLLDPKGGQPTRVGIEREGDTRVRIAKRSGTAID